MVHALTEIHRLLEPGGALIDIHPVGVPMLYEVRRGDALLYSEPELDFCADRYRNAQNALDEVVSRGLFSLDDVRRFDFFIFASSASELRAHLREANAFDSQPEDPGYERRARQLVSRLEKELRAAGPGARVATHEVATMSRLSAIPQGLTT